MQFVFSDYQWFTLVAELSVVKKKEPAVNPKLYSVSKFW